MAPMSHMLRLFVGHNFATLAVCKTHQSSAGTLIFLQLSTQPSKMDSGMEGSLSEALPTYNNLAELICSAETELCASALSSRRPGFITPKHGR